jgi:hypothetical protein
MPRPGATSRTFFKWSLPDASLEGEALHSYSRDERAGLWNQGANGLGDGRKMKRIHSALGKSRRARGLTSYSSQ